MKRLLTLCMFLFCTQLYSGDFHLSLVSLSANKINEDVKFESLRNFDPGHHKHFLLMHQIPESKNFEIKIKRPLIMKDPQSMGFVKEQTKSGQSLGITDLPTSIVTSRGYLPGEKIECWIESENGNSSSVSFIANPSCTKASSGASVSCELVSIFPTTYQLHYSGFEPNEKLKIESISAGERIEWEMPVDKTAVSMLSPEVIGKEEGSSIVTVRRHDGETLKIRLPWGKLLFRYLDGSRPPALKDI